MHVLKWANMSTRMFFAPDDGGGSASASASPPSSSGGDAGGAVPSSSPAGGSDGGSSPPSSPPAPDAAPSTPEPANPWEGLGSMDDLDHIEVPAAPPAAPVVPPPAAPVPPPAATPPEVAPAAPAATPPSPAQPEPQAQPPAPLSPSDPVAIANAMEANRNDVIAHLATSKFALSPEDIQELETDVVSAVPKIMSRVFFETQVAMQKFLAQAVPGMVKQYQTVTKANDDAESKFFEAHKALGLDKSNAQHRATAIRLASLYRQANPTMSLDQLIAEVGPVVAAAVRANAPPAQPSTPAAAMQPRGGTPFRPAVNGGGGAPPVAEPENPWAGLGQNFD